MMMKSSSMCLLRLIALVVLVAPRRLFTLALFVTPDMTPDIVVRKQLDALQQNDMYSVFKHASPYNKATTGPLERFSAMVRTPPYDTLLNHDRAEIMLIMKAPNDQQWVGRIRIWSKKSKNQKLPVDFLWQLSQVPDEGPFQDCWMVDGVFPAP